MTPPPTTRLRAWLADAPSYVPTEDDTRTVDVAGLRLPRRATLVVVVVTFAVLFDWSRTFLPADTFANGLTPEANRLVAIERALLFGILPLAIVVAAFRDRPARYGLRLGDWRAGSAMALVGCAVMTPVVLWFATVPEVARFYAPQAAPAATLVLTHLLDLTAAEFLFRGFLMLTLVRLIGPLGVLLAAWPFVFSHLGKPELELLSTLAGGLAYGWLTWRTGSVIWGAAAHVYILTLVTVAAADAAGAASAAVTLPSWTATW